MTISTVPGSAKPKKRPRGGSRKGKPNKVTKELKDMILGALDKAGGQTYLVTQAKTNPNAFMALIGKVLPTTLASDPKNPVVIGVKLYLPENGRK